MRNRKRPEIGRRPLHAPSESCRGRLVEELVVAHRETSELTESATGCNLGDGGLPWSSKGQHAAGQVHPPQPKIAVRAHPEMLLAMQAQGSVGDAHLPADLDDVQRSVRDRLDDLLKSPNDRGMGTPAHRATEIGFIHEARYHRF